MQYLCLSFGGSRLSVQLFKLDVLIQKILQMKVLVCVLFTSSRMPEVVFDILYSHRFIVLEVEFAS